MKIKFLIVTVLFILSSAMLASNWKTPFIDGKVLLNKANTLVNKKIALSGVVDHVCKHGGQRLKIKFSDIKELIKINVPKNLEKFNIKLNGKKIKVLGILKSVKISNQTNNNNEEHESGFTITQKDGSVLLLWVECEKYEVVK